jgi:hypothetical protein
VVVVSDHAPNALNARHPMSLAGSLLLLYMFTSTSRIRQSRLRSSDWMIVAARRFQVEDWACKDCQLRGPVIRPHSQVDRRGLNFRGPDLDDALQVDVRKCARPSCSPHHSSVDARFPYITRYGHASGPNGFHGPGCCSGVGAQLDCRACPGRIAECASERQKARPSACDRGPLQNRQPARPGACLGEDRGAARPLVKAQCSSTKTGKPLSDGPCATPCALGFLQLQGSEGNIGGAVGIENTEQGIFKNLRGRTRNSKILKNHAKP